MSSGNCILRTITMKDKILSNVSPEKESLVLIVKLVTETI